MKSFTPYTLITGASGGIGFELAVLMASKGHNLVLTSRSEEKLANIARQLIKNHNIKAIAIPADLSLAANRERLINEIRAQNIEIEILVNNAGFGDLSAFETSSMAKNQEMIDLNITALTHLTREFLPEMRSSKSGRIMNVASIAAFMPGPLMSVYYASKAYVLSFGEALAQELRGSGVTVTTLCPGPVASGFQERADFNDPTLMKILKPATTTQLAQYGYKSMMKGKRLAIHGRMNRIMVFMLRFSPRSVVARLVMKLHQ
ncbi:MAG: SDR family oxidoreductase [Lentimicrobium sp.]|nr:SDR family oxidoreductase [Lentimicrobium sp.]